MQLFREAEAEGCVKSSNYLGKIYLEGEGARKNLEKAYQVNWRVTEAFFEIGESK